MDDEADEPTVDSPLNAVDWEEKLGDHGEEEDGASCSNDDDDEDEEDDDDERGELTLFFWPFLEALKPDKEVEGVRVDW